MPDDAKTAFQIYQDVSDGTPVSPVFATLGDLKAWLINEGKTPEAVDTFIAWGFAPSAVVSSRGVEDGIEGLHNATQDKKT